MTFSYPDYHVAAFDFVAEYHTVSFSGRSCQNSWNRPTSTTVLPSGGPSGGHCVELKVGPQGSTTLALTLREPSGGHCVKLKVGPAMGKVFRNDSAGGPLGGPSGAHCVELKPGLQGSTRFAPTKSGTLEAFEKMIPYSAALFLSILPMLGAPAWSLKRDGCAQVLTCKPHAVAPGAPPERPRRIIVNVKLLSEVENGVNV
jgi:hypothetical protein